MQVNYLKRQAEFKALLEQQGYSAMLVLGHENIRYLSGFSGNAAYALITQNACVLITDYRYHQRAIAETTGFEVVCRDRDNETLGHCINRHLIRYQKLAVAYLRVVNLQAHIYRHGVRFYKLAQNRVLKRQYTQHHVRRPLVQKWVLKALAS